MLAKEIFVKIFVVVFILGFVSILFVPNRTVKTYGTFNLNSEVYTSQGYLNYVPKDTYSQDTNVEIIFEQVYQSYLSGTGDYVYYKIFIPHSMEKIEITLQIDSGIIPTFYKDKSYANSTYFYSGLNSIFNIYAKFSSWPTRNNYDLKSDYVSSTERKLVIVNLPSEQNGNVPSNTNDRRYHGWLYLMVYSDFGQGRYTLSSHISKYYSNGKINKYALIVGIKSYKELGDAKYADNAANDWYNFLTEQRYTIYVLGDEHPENYIKYDDKAIEYNIKDYLKYKLTYWADVDDIIAFIFIGHGRRSGDIGTLCAWDFGAGENGEDGEFTEYEIRDFIQFAGAKVFLFFDSCYSGYIDAPVNENPQNNKNVIILTASYSFEYPIDDFANAGWTYFFLKNARSGNASVEYIFSDAREEYIDFQIAHPREYNPIADPDIHDGDTSIGFWL